MQTQISLSGTDTLQTGVTIAATTLPNGTLINESLSITSTGVGAGIVTHAKNLRVVAGNIVGDVHMSTTARANAIDVVKRYPSSNVSLAYTAGNLFLTQ